MSKNNRVSRKFAQFVFITPEKALLYHKKYKKTRKNALQEIDKKIQLCYN